MISYIQGSFYSLFATLTFSFTQRPQRQF